MPVFNLQRLALRDSPPKTLAFLGMQPAGGAAGGRARSHHDQADPDRGTPDRTALAQASQEPLWLLRPSRWHTPTEPEAAAGLTAAGGRLLPPRAS